MAAPRLDAMMRWSVRITTENIFVLCGLLIILLGWVADLFGILEIPGSPDEHPGLDFNLRFFITMFGVAFATIGVGFESFTHMRIDSELGKRYLVAFLFLADGGVHLYALNDHLAEVLPAAFFAVVSSLQLAGAFFFPTMGRELDAAWIGLTAFLIASYIVTRTFAVWPVGVVEAVEPLGVLSKMIETLALVILASLVRSRNRVPEPRNDVSRPSP